ncbi:uncharacterized protein [Triticum aestivum]|uniref:uncharacterized protein isoform X1 n=1 Tax=Triticum aestivum TaxID=4565 RepID=UPI00098BA447|nr:uncharacterized protein LOC109743240 isoform X1 [Aegilops tauschii subsp. strangulata]XP_044441090.1 uncharacterized protein LOC123167306 isoform X1 [Triticum aestivum]
MATEAGHPAWFLTAAEGYVGDRSNERTATGFTRKGLSIKASFFPNRPPQPSKLWVHCQEAVHVDTPRVLCIAGDLILFRVDISDCVPDSRFSMRQDCDYFIYRADPNLPVLTLLTEMRSRCFEDRGWYSSPWSQALHHRCAGSSSSQAPQFPAPFVSLRDIELDHHGAACGGATAGPRL